MTPATCSTLGRLATAFSSLTEEGWFTDIGTWWCISDAVHAVPDGKPYCLVHQQDLLNLEEEGFLFVAHGATDDDGCSLDDEELVGVARHVQSTLLLHGLPAHWDGDIGHRIRIGGEGR